MTTEELLPKLSGGLVEEPQLQLMNNGYNVITLYLGESKLPKLRLRLNQSGQKVIKTEAHRNHGGVKLGSLHVYIEKEEVQLSVWESLASSVKLNPESFITDQLESVKVARIDQALLSGKTKTEYGGLALVTKVIGDGMYMTVSGTPVENIDGVLYDLKWAGHGRDFIRANGTTVTVSTSGKVMR